MIRTEGLHIGYQKELLTVEDLNLDAGLYILAGRNGSGKSTFLKTISGALSPLSGRVFLHDENLHQLRLAELPKKVAFVSTRFPVVDFLRVDEYIALGRSPHTAFFGKLSTNDKALTEQAIEAVGIAHLRHRFTSELSDGERQMVSIARAFAQQSPVITLDEPTAFLDYTNKARILSLLKSLATDFNKCILLSSHDIDLSIEAHCPFLVISAKNNLLRMYPKVTSKSELLELLD